jgi:hypothetical protein
VVGPRTCPEVPLAYDEPAICYDPRVSNAEVARQAIESQNRAQSCSMAHSSTVRE